MLSNLVNDEIGITVSTILLYKEADIFFNCGLNLEKMGVINIV